MSRRLLLLAAVATAAACGADDTGHAFASYVECFDHHVEEGATFAEACADCDGTFDVSHETAESCAMDHDPDVQDGVPLNAVIEHCATIQ